MIIICKWSQIIHNTQSSQISQKQDKRKCKSVPKCMSFNKVIVAKTRRAKLKIEEKRTEVEKLKDAKLKIEENIISENED